jgi:thiosulfate reductase cytochrome b subunit
MTDTGGHDTSGYKGGDLVKRHSVSTRLWHWLNAFTIFTMIGSGLMIFNAHPHLYWGNYGTNYWGVGWRFYDHPWLEIVNHGTQGELIIGTMHINTTGVLGVSRFESFPGWMTLPGSYSLAVARRWHLFFAWVLVLPWVGYLLISLFNRHIQRDLAPTRAELTPKAIWQDIVDHAKLKFPKGAAALHHNFLQKLAYLSVLFALIPTMILSGLSLSPGMTAAWPWLLWLMGGRASARSVHFICMSLIVGFIVVHLALVIVVGPYNEICSMITGKFRLPREKEPKPTLTPAQEPAE